ncbi:MAG: hypothetical protein IPP29_03585 [Bacteroidetes bacterium]|nr:hypothetical protein [Bacteroidota bacterium]MBL0050655.1 hypothetical protein [Bacteroidota bacterium]
MNIKDLHTAEKPVSALPLFKGTEGAATTIKILQGEQLKEHITKVPALLICIEGEAIFENENGLQETLLPGTYVNIEPLVKHWIKGISTCQLVLLK